MEIYKDIINYENHYQLSNYHNIRSIERKVNCKGNKQQTKKSVILKQHISTHGYKYVVLSKFNKREHCFIHRIFAIMFIPNPLNLPWVNHIDGNKLNNNIENLEWCNPSHNIKHAYDNNLRFNNKKVIDLKTNKEYNSITSAALALGYKPMYLTNMLMGRCNNKTTLKLLTI